MSAVPGILHVLSEPGPNITENEFHDWYNNEHGPDRMRLSAMKSGLRYEAIDGLLPTWLATYELNDVAFLQQSAYTRLRENRSPREAHIISQMAILDRGIYQLVTAKGQFSAEPDSTSVTVLLAVPTSSSSDLEDWYTKEHIGMLARIPGWLRSRLLRSETSASSGVAKYLAIHEYTTSNGLGGTEHKAAMSTPWRSRVMSGLVGNGPHRRTYRLRRVISKVPNDLAHLPLESPRVIDSFYLKEDGVKLHYRLEGLPSGPVIAMTNSLLTDLHIWDQVVPRLSTDYMILRYDSRGHGLSASGSIWPKVSELSSDLLSLLSALNIPRIHALVGVSLGGVIGLHFALDNPSRLLRLVVADCNVASSPDNITAWEDRIALARSSNSGRVELANQTLGRWFLPASLEPLRSQGIRAVEQMILSTSLTGFEGGARALCDYDLRDRLPDLEVPALFIAGQGDGILPDTMKRFSSTVPGAKFTTIENAGHLPMVENAEAFCDVLRSFL